MIRNSTQIQIIINGIITWLPWIGNAPDFSSFKEPTLSILKKAWEKGKNNIEVIPEPDTMSVVTEPDWLGLRNRLLGGDLHPIFQRLTITAMQNDGNSISTAKGDISDAILIVNIEEALASGLYLLTQVAGYSFNQEEKDLWNDAITELGFSDLVRI